jgi:hypothetical protein
LLGDWSEVTSTAATCSWSELAARNVAFLLADRIAKQLTSDKHGSIGIGPYILKGFVVKGLSFNGSIVSNLDIKSVALAMELGHFVCVSD